MTTALTINVTTPENSHVVIGLSRVVKEVVKMENSGLSARLSGIVKGCQAWLAIVTASITGCNSSLATQIDSAKQCSTVRAARKQCKGVLSTVLPQRGLKLIRDYLIMYSPEDRLGAHDRLSTSFRVILVNSRGKAERQIGVQFENILVTPQLWCALTSCTCLDIPCGISTCLQVAQVQRCFPQRGACK